MTTTSYNGWANYPTWNVYTWLSNDQSTDEEARAIVTDPNYTLNIERDDAIRNYVADLLHFEDENIAGMSADLLGWALSQVDWREITTAYIDAANE